MAFVAADIAPPERLLPVTISTTDRAGTGRPSLIWGIASAFLNANSFALGKGAHFTLHLGTDDDAGKVRLVRARQGIAARVMKRGGVIVNSGHVPAISLAPGKVRCNARVIDANTIEIDLPPPAPPEPEPVMLSHDDRQITMIVGKERVAKLQTMADEAGRSIESFASRMFAELIDEAAAV